MGKTAAQKIFAAHLVDTPADGVYVLSLDRVFCHEGRGIRFVTKRTGTFQSGMSRFSFDLQRFSPRR